jgi:hypothetical protein
VSGQLHSPRRYTPVQSPGMHYTGGCVDPRAGLDDMEGKFFDPNGIRTARRYTDRATAAHGSQTVKKLRGLNLRTNYTNRATAACR